jgi:hypothetical protein
MERSGQCKITLVLLNILICQDKIIARLRKESSVYKYMVSVTLADKNITGPIFNTTGAYWNADKDGLWKYKWANDNVEAIITIVWISMS